MIVNVFSAKKKPLQNVPKSFTHIKTRAFNVTNRRVIPTVVRINDRQDEDGRKRTAKETSVRNTSRSISCFQTIFFFFILFLLFFFIQSRSMQSNARENCRRLNERKTIYRLQSDAGLSSQNLIVTNIEEIKTNTIFIFVFCSTAI